MTDRVDDSPTHFERSATPAWPLVALLVLVAAVFGQLCRAEFVSWDDDGTLAKNVMFAAPLGEQFRFAWTHFDKGLYVPVTISVWTLLASVSETRVPDATGSLINPWLFHSTNVLLHLCSTAFVYLLLRRLSRTQASAWIGAALFALHPIQVEAVAWASGLKDVLCWCFAAAATLLYVGVAQGARERTPQCSAWRSSPGTMAAILVLLALALLSKPSALVLPAVLFIVDVLLIRVGAFRRVAIDLVPAAAVAAAGALVGRLAQYVHHIDAAPLWGRPFIVGDSLTHYSSKVLWPVSMGIDYGRKPAWVLAQPMAYVEWLVPAAILVVAWRVRRRAPRVFAGIAVTVVSLGPVLGLVTFQMQGYSTVTDHYFYFAMIGVALLATDLVDRAVPNHRRLTYAIAGSCIALLTVRAAHQAWLWRDSLGILAHSINLNPRSAAMRNNLAGHYASLDPPQFDLATPLIEQAYALDPTSPLTIGNVITTRALRGELQKDDPDVKQLRRIIDARALDPWDRMRRLCDVSGLLLSNGVLDEAREWAEAALAEDPTSFRAQQAIVAVERAERARAATRPATTSPSTRPN